jgi:cytochrome P450
MEGAIAQIGDDLLSGIRAGEPADWARVATLLPLRVVASLVGLPDSDIPLIERFTNILESIGDDLPIEDLEAVGADFLRLREYVLGYLRDKRADPKNDLLSALASPDNDHLGEANILMLAMLVVAAAGGTTRALLLGMIWGLAQHPDQAERLRADRPLVPSTIEETLRYVTTVRASVPAHRGFRHHDPGPFGQGRPASVPDVHGRQPRRGGVRRRGPLRRGPQAGRAADLVRFR